MYFRQNFTRLAVVVCDFCENRVSVKYNFSVQYTPLLPVEQKAGRAQQQGTASKNTSTLSQMLLCWTLPHGQECNDGQSQKVVTTREYFMNLKIVVCIIFLAVVFHCKGHLFPLCCLLSLFYRNNLFMCSDFLSWIMLSFWVYYQTSVCHFVIACSFC